MFGWRRRVIKEKMYQPFMTANKCKQTKANSCKISSRTLASHDSMKTPSNHNCTLSKLWNLHVGGGDGVLCQISKLNSLQRFPYHSHVIGLQIIIDLIVLIGLCVTRKIAFPKGDYTRCGVLISHGFKQPAVTSSSPAWSCCLSASCF